MHKKFFKTLAFGLTFMFANNFCAAENISESKAASENYQAQKKLYDEMNTARYVINLTTP